MSIEAARRAGMVAPDDKTFEFPWRDGNTRPRARTGIRRWHCGGRCEVTIAQPFDREVRSTRARSKPMVTWGTSTEDALRSAPPYRSRRRCRWRPACTHGNRRCATRPRARHAAAGHKIDRRVHRHLHQWPDRGLARRAAVSRQKSDVPSWVSRLMTIKRQAEARAGSHFPQGRIRLARSGLSSCASMNGDIVPAGERCARRRTAISKAARARARAPSDEPGDGRRGCDHWRITDVRKL